MYYLNIESGSKSNLLFKSIEMKPTTYCFTSDRDSKVLFFNEIGVRYTHWNGGSNGCTTVVKSFTLDLEYDEWELELY